MSNNNNNNNKNRPGDEIEKMHQKNGSCNDSSCKDDSIKKGAAQEHGKPMQQGKPAQGQHQGSQKPATSGNGDIKKYSTHQQENDEGLDSSSEVESNKKNKGW